MYVLMLVKSRMLFCSRLYASLCVKFDQILALTLLKCGLSCAVVCRLVLCILLPILALALLKSESSCAVVLVCSCCIIDPNFGPSSTEVWE